MDPNLGRSPIDDKTNCEIRVFQLNVLQQQFCGPDISTKILHYLLITINKIILSSYIVKKSFVIMGPFEGRKFQTRQNIFQICTVRNIFHFYGNPVRTFLAVSVRHKFSIFRISRGRNRSRPVVGHFVRVQKYFRFGFQIVLNVKNTKCFSKFDNKYFMKAMFLLLVLQSRIIMIKIMIPFPSGATVFFIIPKFGQALVDQFFPRYRI